ncbi:MAG: DNRLRE domain-containing protein [Phycisphaerae bacterium]|nr:DNRLRE domain-containing protein [Phycisphaerae bacterium]
MSAYSIGWSRNLLLPAVCLLLASSSVLAQGSAFTIVALPDTQHYSDSEANMQHFYNQTQWIVDSIAEENIAFVTHLGDVTQSGDDSTEWNRVMPALNTLETGGDYTNAAYVPYSVCRGNHDGTSSFTANLGSFRYTGESWYGGASSDDRCHYQTFSAGGYNFLHLNLDYNPTADHLTWAQGVINSHSGLPTIVSTHNYMTSGGRTSTGDDIWSNLINNNSQIFMALCGHMHYEYQQISTNASGDKVIEMLSDFQEYTEGGMGYLRKIEFDVPNNKINVQTYSPSLNSYQKDPNSYFSYDVTFGASDITVNGLTLPDDVTRVSSQNGFNGYDGTTDTQVREEYPTTTYGDATTLKIDNDDPGGSGSENHVLIKFDNLFGEGEGQVPLDKEIINARLVLNITNDGSAFSPHRMLRSWSESDTWDSLSEGVSTDDVEAAADADSTTSSVAIGLLEVDVTQSVLQWQCGDTNYGWVLKSTSTDGVIFSSSEYATESPRPMLVIDYVPEPTSLLLLAVGAVTLVRRRRRG